MELHCLNLNRPQECFVMEFLSTTNNRGKNTSSLHFRKKSEEKNGNFRLSEGKINVNLTIFKSFAHQFRVPAYTKQQQSIPYSIKQTDQHFSQQMQHLT